MTGPIGRGREGVLTTTLTICQHSGSLSVNNKNRICPTLSALVFYLTNTFWFSSLFQKLLGRIARNILLSEAEEHTQMLLKTVLLNLPSGSASSPPPPLFLWVKKKKTNQTNKTFLNKRKKGQKNTNLRSASSPASPPLSLFLSVQDTRSR